MPRKLILKRLTASDLTLFKWQFENRPAGKQKAFNLDSDVLVNKLYPYLGEPAEIPRPRYPLDLDLLGPGMAPAHDLQRKILKQQKNWRLNGELIHNPEDDPDRYNILVAGDYALIEFSGTLVPDAARIVLLAENALADAEIHAELSRRYPQGSMWVLQESDVSAILTAAPPPEGHPIYEWVDGDSVEDAVLGGAAGVAGVSKRRGGRGLSPEEFLRARQAAEHTGVAGEEYLNAWFERQLEAGQIESFEWVSSVNAISPFDFRIRLLSGEERLLDAKSTNGPFGNPIHLSLSELRCAVSGMSYDIYRIYELSETSAKLRIAKDVGPSLRQIVHTLDSLPAGVAVDAVSLRPDLLNFSSEEVISDEE